MRDTKTELLCLRNQFKLYKGTATREAFGQSIYKHCDDYVEKETCILELRDQVVESAALTPWEQFLHDEASGSGIDLSKGLLRTGPECHLRVLREIQRAMLG